MEGACTVLGDDDCPWGISYTFAIPGVALVAAGAADVPGGVHPGHLHFHRGDVVLRGADAARVDVEATSGPGMGALLPGLPKADPEPDSPNDEPEENQDYEDEKESVCMERELSLIHI